MNKFIIFGLLFTLSLAMSLTSLHAQQSSTSTSNVKTVILPVEGMTCVSCVSGIKKSLKNMLGVTSVAVDLKDRNAKVTYIDGLTSPEAISKKISELGYKVGKPVEASK